MLALSMPKLTRNVVCGKLGYLKKDFWLAGFYNQQEHRNQERNQQSHQRAVNREGCYKGRGQGKGRHQNQSRGRGHLDDNSRRA